MKKLKLLWHEPSNCLCVADLNCPIILITFLDDDFKGINPNYAYPLKFLLNNYGYVDLGDL